MSLRKYQKYLIIIPSDQTSAISIQNLSAMPDFLPYWFLLVMTARHLRCLAYFREVVAAWLVTGQPGSHYLSEKKRRVSGSHRRKWDGNNQA
jgi:hypothetical protein